jgi:predicted transcriptional regulator
MQPVERIMQGKHRLTGEVATAYAPDVRRFLLWGFKSSRELLENSLGSLERQVMTLAWERPEISVREACERMGSSVAYTTVMTTMDRLYKKGFLARRKVGRAFVYQAAASRDEIEHAVATELVHGLLQRNASEPLPILSSLVDAVSDRDRKLLDDLERLVREKRRMLERKKSR